MSRCTDRLWLFNTPYRVILFGSLFVTLLAISAWVAMVRIPVQAELERRGVEASATIIAVRYEDRVRATRGGLTEVITYQFSTTTGDLVEFELRRSYDFKGRMAPGGIFTVTYLPEHPARHYSELRPVFADWKIVYATLIFSALVFAMLAYETRKLPGNWEGPRLRPIIRSNA